MYIICSDSDSKSVGYNIFCYLYIFIYPYQVPVLRDQGQREGDDSGDTQTRVDHSKHGQQLAEVGVQVNLPE